MSGVGVEFVGGPLDGQERWINWDPMNPPATYECVTASAWTVDSVIKHTYRREVSTRDHGVLWLYRWAGEQRQ